MCANLYKNGEYLELDQFWHTLDSPWKARHILKMMKKNNIAPKTICEVGCGAGEVLVQLKRNMDQECIFRGYDIAPKAIELCQERAADRLDFKLGDILQEEGVYFDLVLLIDLIEHLENYFDFLREIKPKSKYKILHIPLDLSAQWVLRSNPLMTGWKIAGHINYFTKDIALQVLKDMGYEIIDYFYVGEDTKLPAKSFKSRIVRPFKKMLFSIHKDFAVRLLGGYSLMVLAK